MEKIYKLHVCIPVYGIDWQYLSENPAAIYLLEANTDKVNWY